MKKKAFYIFLLLSIPGILSAQHVLQSELNMFRSDDVIVKQQVGYKDPGRTGSDVLWDFSRLEVVNDEYEVFYSSYDNDTTVIGMEHLTRYRYGLQNDSLLLWGFENQTTQLVNNRPELLLKFPVCYGDTVKSYFYGHGKYGNRLELDVMGTVETAADSYGTMILPNNDTLKHVLRTRTLKYIAEASRPIGDEYFEKLQAPLFISSDSIDRRLAADSVLFVVETFRWYEKGYRYPIFETVRSWEQNKTGGDYEFLNTAFFYPPREHYYLDNDDENLALLDDETADDAPVNPWEGLTYNLYPNPVKTTLSLEIHLPKPATIKVQLRNTMGLIALNENKGHHPQGVYNFPLNVEMLPIGDYVLDIWLDEHLISAIVMKR